MYCTKCRKKKHLKSRLLCEKCLISNTALRYLGSRRYAGILYDKLQAQDHKCYLTGRTITIGIDATIDHFIPRSKVRKRQDTIHNLFWCHKDANRIKSDLSIPEFITIAREIIKKWKSQQQ